MTGPTLLLNVARAWDGQDTVVAAEHALASGLDGVGLVDSPRLFPDGWVETERVLSGTPARLAGPCVSSLGLRHPVTVAGAVRTLERHHPGRVLTVVGRGESSVRNEGLAVPSMRAYSDSLHRLRDLLAVDDGAGAPGRVLGAASGPRTVAATAAALGAVLVDAGAHAEVVSRAVALARRDDPATTVWLFVRAVVTSSEQESAAAAEPLIGSCASRLAGSPQWYGIDDTQLDAVRTVAQMHDYRRHGTDDARGGAAAEADQLVRERFVLTGTAAQISARLRPLAGLGIGGVVVAGAMRGVTERLPELVEALRVGLAPDRAPS